MTLDAMGFQPLKRDINPQSYRWCFTWNNYNDTDNWREIIDKELQRLVCNYYIYGEEVAPTTGTQHLQGYFRSAKRIYKNTLTNSTIKWHVEVARGSEDENINYCKKEGKYVEFGEPLLKLKRGKMRQKQKRN